MRCLFALLLLLPACRTAPLDFDGGVPGSDLAVPIVVVDAGARDLARPRGQDLNLTPTSCCGVAGNPGNEFGVGAFCQTSAQCQTHMATICATSFTAAATFCTMMCTMNGSATQCGSGATCQCASTGQCACIPGECLMPPPGC